MTGGVAEYLVARHRLSMARRRHRRLLRGGAGRTTVRNATLIRRAFTTKLTKNTRKFPKYFVASCPSWWMPSYMITSVVKASFNGLRVLSLESRRANEIASLISTFGGRPTVAPALRELPRSSNAEALAFGAALVKGEFDAVVFLTGVGARALLNVIEAEQSRAAFTAALARTKVIARGPKPVAVLREWRVPVWVSAPEPNTWRELLAAVDDAPRGDGRGRRSPPRPRSPTTARSSRSWRSMPRPSPPGRPSASADCAHTV